MRRRIGVLVTVALVMTAVMASSALPAWAVPISEMSCAQLKQASEEAGLDLAFAEGQRKADLKARLAALGKEAERKGCGEFVRNSGGGFTVKMD
jgi:hypothetical protein